MSRLLVAFLAALASAGLPVATSVAKEGSENQVSELREIRPSVPGLELEVIEGDRFLLLENRTSRTVLVDGYDDEPYLRFSANGRVEVNTRSPSKYVNEDRYGQRPVPSTADSSAPPRWQPVAGNGSYRWFDHRIHLMTPGTPEDVKDESKRYELLDWRVPMTVGGRRVAAIGTLSWIPASSDSGGSGALIAIVAAVAALAAIAAFVLLRRRGRRPAAESTEPKEEKAKEAW
jgi:hypothetical protein